MDAEKQVEEMLEAGGEAKGARADMLSQPSVNLHIGGEGLSQNNIGRSTHLHSREWPEPGKTMDWTNWLAKGWLSRAGAGDGDPALVCTKYGRTEY